MTRAKTPPAADNFAVAVLHAGAIRVDVYGHANLDRGGNGPGWGTATLSLEDAKRLCVALTGAAASAAPKKRTKK